MATLSLRKSRHARNIYLLLLLIAPIASSQTSQRAQDFIQNGWYQAVGSKDGFVTEDSIVHALGPPPRVSREKQPNRHDPTALNEIVQMHYDGLDITILKTPLKVLVKRVIVTGSQILVGEGLVIGTPATRLDVLGEGRVVAGRRCYYNEAGYEDTACFLLRDGAIARIEWQYILD